MLRNIISQGSQYKLHLYLFLARKGFLDSLTWENKKICFIISTGRTGTKTLAALFNHLENVEAHHEPQPDFRQLSIDFALERVCTAKAQSIVNADRKVVLFRMQRLNPHVYVEANNRLFSLIPILRQTFRGCKFVHIVRDGRDVVRSGMGRRWYQPDDIDPYRLKAIDFPNDPYFEYWQSMSRFEKICWWWQKKDGIIYQSVKNESDSITVKFEDIFDESNDYAGLKAIGDFLDIDVSTISHLISIKRNATETYQMPHWQNWDLCLREKFMKISGEHLKQYGYVNDELEWQVLGLETSF